MPVLRNNSSFHIVDWVYVGLCSFIFDFDSPLAVRCRVVYYLSMDFLRPYIYHIAPRSLPKRDRPRLGTAEFICAASSPKYRFPESGRAFRNVSLPRPPVA